MENNHKFQIHENLTKTIKCVKNIEKINRKYNKTLKYQIPTKSIYRVNEFHHKNIMCHHRRKFTFNSVRQGHCNMQKETSKSFDRFPRKFTLKMLHKNRDNDYMKWIISW